MENIPTSVTTIVNLSLFTRWLSNLDSFVTLVLANHHPVVVAYFRNKMSEFLKYVVEFGKQASPELCMQFYNNLLARQHRDFIIIHNSLIQAYVAAEIKAHQQLLEKQQEEAKFQQIVDAIKNLSLGLDEMDAEHFSATVTTVPTATFFTATTSPVVSLTSIQTQAPFSSERSKFVVDGMNILARILDAINGTPEDLGFMNESRTAKQHQFNSDVDKIRAFEYAKLFFSKAVPAGSHIIFVIKEFGSPTQWKSFLTDFADTFLDKTIGLPHDYELCVALPEYHGDGECDDRLVARLAILYDAHIISNDKYRSMPDHWDNASTYHCYEDKNQINTAPILDSIDEELDVADLENVPRIDYKFWVGSKDIFTGLSDLCMSVIEVN
ncbi:hypothetical protein QJ856_gp1155 [Tupanvirus deep ocean]|uniref:Uncharacterized protein n=2 Tax=Tupanvirus TaxID=2094720 RepID=A0AC62A7K9_9VIRU|nr:hypothetical protein QJ856_gp1155 [Tupanvirus deep ocean]QKU33603.1 hypothetical protein [Tupanvirus deep ocean]